MSPAAPRRIVVFSLEPWDDVWRRNQYLIDALLRADPTLEVIVVEPPEDPVHRLVTRRRPRLGKGLRQHEGYGGRLHLLQPTKWLPRRLGRWADALMEASVRRGIRHLSWQRPLLWINDPRWAGFATASRWPSLYDITDDWVLADRPERERRRLAEADATLLAGCDEVVVCSTALGVSKGLARARAGANPVTLIPNAVDVDRYRLPYDRPDDLPDAPVALYAGTLHEDRLDVDLVLHTAERLAEFGARLVLLGPNALSRNNTARLEASAGAVLLGARPSGAIPAYLQHATALVVPHLVDDFTDSLDPIKLYEYLAVGRPIVSTPVAGFRQLAGEQAVTIVGADDGFAEAVLAAVSSWVPASIRSGVPTWTERAQAMLAVIERIDAPALRRDAEGGVG